MWYMSHDDIFALRIFSTSSVICWKGSFSQLQTSPIQTNCNNMKAFTLEISILFYWSIDPDDSRFIVDLEVRQCTFSNFVLFRIFFPILCPLNLHINIGIILTISIKMLLSFKIEIVLNHGSLPRVHNPLKFWRTSDP